MQSLIDLLPRMAEKRSDDGAYVSTPINDLKIGDVILVRPGMTLPVDGVVVSGTSHVNEAAITGEPLCVFCFFIYFLILFLFFSLLIILVLHEKKLPVWSMLALRTTVVLWRFV